MRRMPRILVILENRCDSNYFPLSVVRIFGTSNFEIQCVTNIQPLVFAVISRTGYEKFHSSLTFIFRDNALSCMLIYDLK